MALTHDIHSLVEDFSVRFDALKTLADELRRELTTALNTEPLGNDATDCALMIDDNQPCTSQDIIDAACDVFIAEGRNRCLGAIVALPRHHHAIELLHQLNAKKDEFALWVRELKSQLGVTAYRDVIQHVKRISRLSSLDLTRCYRHNRVYDQPIARISFTWYRGGRTVRSLTKADVEQRLLSSTLSDEAKHAFVSELRNDPQERFACVDDYRLSLRANLAFRDPKYPTQLIDDHQVISGPVFCVAPLPRSHNVVYREKPDLDEPSTRMRRKDARIDPEPWIRALRIHRYLA